MIPPNWLAHTWRKRPSRTIHEPYTQNPDMFCYWSTRYCCDPKIKTQNCSDPKHNCSDGSDTEQQWVQVFMLMYGSACPLLGSLNIIGKNS